MLADRNHFAAKVGEWGRFQWSLPAIVAITPNYGKRGVAISTTARRFQKDKDLPAIVCAISDISETGARLNLKDDVELPDTFFLSFSY